MTENTDGDDVCSRIAGLVAEFEQSRDFDSTEIGRQFAQLQRTMIENKDILSCNEGAKPNNRLKNRYKDVLPYDKCRVILESVNNSDYINASFIEDLDGKRRYIAAQGPIEESLPDFFRMIWDFKIESIICTANDIEAGRFKFRRYWPDEEESLQFGSYHISKDQSNDKSYTGNDYEIRPLIIQQGETQRHVLLYHFLHWPDHDIPNDEKPILDLLLRLYQDRNSSVDSPILVHCSAGCGRTGSIIAIDFCRLLLNDEHLSLSKNYQPNPVFKIASHIRQFRVALIQTVKQYLFVHKMFLFLLKANGNISSCPIANNDENQTCPTLTTKPSPPSAIPSSVRRLSGQLQIKLRNPPVGRRLLNGTMSNTPSPTTSPSEFSSLQSKSSSVIDTPHSPDPPPIPPRLARMNTTTKPYNDQFETALEADYRNFCLENSRRKKLTNNRSDSADAHYILSSRHHQQVSSEQEINSD